MLNDNALPFTLEIILNSIVTFLFVLKKNNNKLKKKGRKKKNTQLGFKPGTFGFRGQRSNQYTTATSINFLQFITILYCTHGGCWHGMRSWYAESHVVTR